MWMSFGSVVGSGIFVITGQEARENAGPAIVLSYALSGFSALLSVFCYTEFAVEIPVAGGSFSYLRVELGDFIAYLAAGNILLEAVIGAAGLGRSWSSYFASMINTKNPDFMRIKIDSFADGFNLLDPLAVVVLLVANSIAMKGVFVAAAVVYWAYTGFDMVATMAEETKNPSRDIPIGLVGSMSIITVVYCLMALALTGMVKYTEIDPNAAFSVAFAQIGMKWATVHPKTGTPIYATLLTTILSAIVAFFTSLDVLSTVFSISTLLIFMLLAVALLVRRYYVKDVISKNDSVTFFVCLFTIAGSSIGVTALWNSGVRGLDRICGGFCYLVFRYSGDLFAAQEPCS
ncbi:hypothetical protein OIU84_024568 [Salix udensis]|uniref:Amino acid permease/ SLC12A domain-containing protein n=1 Tax=Salix udensis TaxID=889485 RepID=A0AAD6KJC7_9ROSI|nr:hypothetical protein OIU84_024568 [Salix udensis]